MEVAEARSQPVVLARGWAPLQESLRAAPLTDMRTRLVTTQMPVTAALPTITPASPHVAVATRTTHCQAAAGWKPVGTGLKTAGMQETSTTLT